eukprot:2518648-Rhodomonas_salina.1
MRTYWEGGSARYPRSGASATARSRISTRPRLRARPRISTAHCRPVLHIADQYPTMQTALVRSRIHDVPVPDMA